MQMIGKEPTITRETMPWENVQRWTLCVPDAWIMRQTRGWYRVKLTFWLLRMIWRGR